MSGTLALPPPLLAPALCKFCCELLRRWVATGELLMDGLLLVVMLLVLVLVLELELVGDSTGRAGEW